MPKYRYGAVRGVEVLRSPNSYDKKWETVDGAYLTKCTADDLRQIADAIDAYNRDTTTTLAAPAWTKQDNVYTFLEKREVTLTARFTPFSTYSASVRVNGVLVASTEGSSYGFEQTKEIIDTWLVETANQFINEVKK